jgi:O-antigen ligase
MKGTNSVFERIDFILLCLFVLSQAYTVPLLTIGPSWAVWPTAGDALVAAMTLVVTVRVCAMNGMIQNKASRRILVLLLLLLAGCTFSYLIFCRAMPILYRTEAGRAADFGEYQFYRIAQAVLAFVFASQVRLTPSRRRALAFTAAAALVIVCAALFLEYLGIVPASTYAGHLPKSTSIAGPWGYYATDEGAIGYGTIGYTHAYSSSQVLLLLVLVLLLRPGARSFTRAALVFVAEAAILVSGCRSVLVGSLVFVAAFFIRRPRTLAAFGCIFLVAAFIAELAPTTQDLLRPAVDRASVLNPFEDVYSGGRPQLWASQIEYLNEQPLRWAIGAGFGTSAGETGNDNILYLQIINEMGALGLASFIFAFGEIFRQLYRAGPDSRPMVFGTVAILVSSIAQETLYPVPAMGQFIAFYSLCLALALRPERRPVRYWMLFRAFPAAETDSRLTPTRALRAYRPPIGAIENPECT